MISAYFRISFDSLDIGFTKVSTNTGTNMLWHKDGSRVKAILTKKKKSQGPGGVSH